MTNLLGFSPACVYSGRLQYTEDSRVHFLAMATSSSLLQLPASVSS